MFMAKNHACMLWAMLTSTYYLNQTSPNCNRTSSTHFHFHTFPSPLSHLAPGPFLLYFTGADGIGIHLRPLYPILSYPLFFSSLSLSLSLCLFILFHDRHRAHLHAKNDHNKRLLCFHLFLFSFLLPPPPPPRKSRVYKVGPGTHILHLFSFCTCRGEGDRSNTSQR